MHYLRLGKVDFVRYSGYYDYWLGVGVGVVVVVFQKRKYSAV
jgi:hypothetical protein